MVDDRTGADDKTGVGETWPFDMWLKLAVVRFGLTPADFWAMSLRDWLTLVGRPQNSGMSTAEFAELSAEFPDTFKPKMPNQK